MLLLAYRTYTKNYTVSKYCAQVGRFEWNTLLTSSLRVSVTLFLRTCITLALSPPSCSFLLLMVTETLATDIQREIEKLFISLFVLFSTSVSVFCNHLKPISSNQIELSFASFWQFDFSNWQQTVYFNSRVPTFSIISRNKYWVWGCIITIDLSVGLKIFTILAKPRVFLPLELIVNKSYLKWICNFKVLKKSLSSNEIYKRKQTQWKRKRFPKQTPRVKLKRDWVSKKWIIYCQRARLGLLTKTRTVKVTSIWTIFSLDSIKQKIFILKWPGNNLNIT